MNKPLHTSNYQSLGVGILAWRHATSQPSKSSFADGVSSESQINS